MIELPKADRLQAGGGALAAWVAYFQHWQDEAVMSTITHAPVQQASRQLEELSADEETRRLADVREKALRDEASFLKAAREEGRQEGREEGRGEGALESSLRIGRRLLESMDDLSIARLTDLDEGVVRRLRHGGRVDDE